MKKILIAAVFIVAALPVFAGCNVQTDQPSTVPVTPTTNQNVTGLFAGVNVLPGGNSTISIITANGTRTFPLASNASLSLGGQSCSLNDLAAIQSGDTSYNCTVAYNDAIGVFGVYVTGGTTK